MLKEGHAQRLGLTAVFEQRNALKADPSNYRNTVDTTVGALPSRRSGVPYSQAETEQTDCPAADVCRAAASAAVPYADTVTCAVSHWSGSCGKHVISASSQRNLARTNKCGGLECRARLPRRWKSWVGRAIAASCTRSSGAVRVYRKCKHYRLILATGSGGIITPLDPVAL